jgi:hypothetical protein
MPTFELEKGGKTYEVEAPDQAAALSALPKIEAGGLGGGAGKPERGVVDKLLGIGGERYQTFPERAVRGLAAIPGKLIDAAASAPAGSHEASEAMAGPAFETALATTPLSPAMRGAAAATGVAAPTVKDIETASHGQYQAAREMTVPLETKAVSEMAEGISTDLAKVGYRDYLAPKTFRALEELKALKNPTYADVESVRQLLNRAGADPLEKDAVRRAIDGIDDFVSELPEVGEVAGKARGNWSSKKRAETIQEALDKAERQAGSAHSGANTDNSIRQQIKAIRNNPKKARGFTEDELAQMDAIIHGTTTGNLLRTGGNLLGGGGGLGAAVTAGAGALAAGPLGAAAPLIGYGLKQAGGASTRRQVEQLLEMIRRRSPAAEEKGATAMPTPSKPEAEGLAAPARGAAGMMPDASLSYQSPLGPNQL